MLPTSSNFFDTSSVVISSVAVWMIFRSSVGGSAPGAAPLPPALPPDVLAAAGASAMEPLCRAASALSYDLSCASGAGAFAIDLCTDGPPSGSPPCAPDAGLSFASFDDPPHAAASSTAVTATAAAPANHR
jgi:hypothetical protein